MDNAFIKFAHEIVNDVYTRQKSGKHSVVSSQHKLFTDEPVLYNQRCKYIVNNYFTYYEQNITKYYRKDCESLNKLAFISIAQQLRMASEHHHQCSESFYRLCIQLALLGSIAVNKGNCDGLSLAVAEITPLAKEAYYRCDLDEKYDHMFNFSYDILKYVFDWAECKVNFDRDLTRLNFDCGSLNYFDTYRSYFTFILYSSGRSALKRYNEELGLRALTRDVFLFRIQDYCDNYCTQLGQCTTDQARAIFFETCMHISLLTLNVFETLYPSDFRLAHERMLRLAIVTTRYGSLKFKYFF